MSTFIFGYNTLYYVHFHIILLILYVAGFFPYDLNNFITISFESSF